jgi:hypothetical protein
MSIEAIQAPARITRIRAQIPVRITSLEPGVNFSERCHTLVVNTEGCGVRLSQRLEPGVPVILNELPDGRAVQARVSNCVALGTDGSYWLVGIALEQPGNVWCIQPAPADWNELTPSEVTVPLPKKSEEWPYSFFSGKGEAHPGRK